MITKEDLQAFCGKRENMKTPWSRGDYTYATNGKIIIRVPRLDDVPENAIAPDPEGLFLKLKPVQEWYNIPEVKKPKTIRCPDCGGDGVNIPCPECDGTGEVELSNSYNEYRISCASCNGTGKMPKCPECEGVGRIEQTQTIDIGIALFNQKYFWLLRNFSNCKIGITGEYDVNIIKFDGGDGLLMPMRKD